jgi:hypothetical protein
VEESDASPIMTSPLSFGLLLEITNIQHNTLEIKLTQFIVGFGNAHKYNTLGLLLMEKHNQIDHVLTDKRQRSHIIDAQSFRGGDCNTDHYLVVAEVRKRCSE